MMVYNAAICLRTKYNYRSLQSSSERQFFKTIFAFAPLRRLSTQIVVVLAGISQHNIDQRQLLVYLGACIITISDMGFDC